MDLYAYVQIDDLSKIAQENGIYVPRLRGYRLMRDEELIPEEDMDKLRPWFYENLIDSRPMFSSSPIYRFYCSESEKLYKYYLKFNDKNEPIDVNWSRLSSKRKKTVKIMIRNQQRLQRKQYETFNKYVGRDDVLYIHARIGGNNWKYFEGDLLIAEPWFIEACDDSFDDTYCDIYARIKPVGGTK